MKISIFNKIFHRRTGKMGSTLVTKGSEYAPGEDRLHNFRRIFQILDGRIKLSDIVLILGLKHLVCLLDIVEKDEPVSQEYLDEKQGDWNCYMVLFEAAQYEEGNVSEIKDGVIFEEPAVL